jgi:proteasome lid subunit RPN8/RPN11
VRLALPPPLGARILSEAQAARPREACGLIEGLCRGDLLIASALHLCSNRAVGEGRFAIDPQEQIALVKRLRGGETSLIGCWHSHPGGKAAPSARDIACGGPEGFVWLIAAEAALAAFICPDFRFVELI